MGGERSEDPDRRIPIINSSELLSLNGPFGTDSAFSFDGYQVNQRNHSLDMHRHYWQDCTSGSVCITTGGGFSFLGNAMERLTDVLQFFKDNQKVYILQILSDKVEFVGDGFGIAFWEDEEASDEENPVIGREERMRNQLILNFAADDVMIRLEKEKQKRYFKEVLRSHIVRNGMGVVKGFSYEKVMNLIRIADIRHAIGRAVMANQMQAGSLDKRIGF